MQSVAKKRGYANRRAMCGCSPSVLTPVVCNAAKRDSGTGSTTRADVVGIIIHDARFQGINLFRLPFEALSAPCVIAVSLVEAQPRTTRAIGRQQN
jgi:hypothetical protein